MRGKDSFISFSSSLSGITPAHAGKRYILNRERKSDEDHPRTCGEKPATFFWRKNLSGSPPHMRGKVRLRNYFDNFLKDHPRTCGEKVLACGRGQPAFGSPPHMRGKDSAFFHSRGLMRITPAHAGKRTGLII